MTPKKLILIAAVVVVLLLALGMAGAVAVGTGLIPMGSAPPADDRTVAGADTLADRLGLPALSEVLGTTEPATLDPGPALPPELFEDESLRAAARLIADDQPADALVALGEPASPGASALRAVALAESGELDAAEEALDGSKDEPVLHARAAFRVSSLRMNEAESPFARMRAATAGLAAADALLAVEPEHFGANQYALFAARFTPKPMGGDPDKAWAIASAGLERGDDRYLIVLSVLHRIDKQGAEATDFARRAMEAGVYDQRTYISAAGWLIDEQRPDEALPFLAACARIDPGVPAVCDELVRYYEATGDPGRAQIAREALADEETGETRETVEAEPAS